MEMHTPQALPHATAIGIFMRDALQVDQDGDVLVQRRRNIAPPQPEDAQPPQQQEDVVLSEVHLECQRPAPGQAAATLFTTAAGCEVARIRHALATPLSRVGLQVWRGALLLADYVLQQGAASPLGGSVALELGAGPGLAGLVLARLAHAVFLTDVGSEVLNNLALNAASAAPPQQQQQGALHVRHLDWLDPPDWLVPPSSQGGAADAPRRHGERHAWRPGDAEQLQRLGVLLAADCVYDDVLTEAFMRSAVLLMQHAQRHSGRAPRLLVALERRVCFTMVDLAARAPAYDHWRTLFREVQAPGAAPNGAAADACEAGAGPAAAEARAGGQGSASPPPFPLVGWRLDVGAIPQAIQQYQRSEYLELWELALATGGTC